MMKALWVYAVALCVFALSFPTWAADAAKTETPKKDAAKATTKTETTDKKKVKEMLAVFETNMGTFKVKLFNEQVPKTIDNFVGLAEGTKEFTDPKTGGKTKRKFYDGLVFHRIIPNFMIQGGDPLGNGTGGPGYKFEDEIVPELKHSKPGILSMANAGPNTNGSQFFITVAQTSWLDGKHTVFGEVVEGMDVINKMAVVKTASGDRPLEPVVLKHVVIERK